MASSATIRDLRTRFPAVRRMLQRDGEVIVTDHGRPLYVLRCYSPPAQQTSPPVDYLARLLQRMPLPMGQADMDALDGANREER